MAWGRGMSGWFVPPPSEPVKDGEDLRREREAKVEELRRRGLLRSEPIRLEMLSVRREDFVPRGYRDLAYEEIPLPLPGARATISCPHSYPVFYEPLGLGPGDRFLKVGVGRDTARRSRGRSSARQASSSRSSSTPSRSRSPGATSSAPGTRTSCSCRATAGGTSPSFSRGAMPRREGP